MTIEAVLVRFKNKYGQPVYNGHLGNGKVSGIYRVTVIHIYRSTFQKICGNCRKFWEVIR